MFPIFETDTGVTGLFRLHANQELTYIFDMMVIKDIRKFLATKHLNCLKYQN